MLPMSPPQITSVPSVPVVADAPSSAPVRVMVVPADEAAPIRLEESATDHESWCGLVRDVNTATVFFADGTGVVKVAGNGARRGMGVNVRATQTVERFVPGFTRGDRVLGDAVFVGLDDEDDYTDVSGVVVEFVTSLFGAPVVAERS